MRKNRCFFSDESGNMTILLAVALTSLLGMAAIAVDYSVLAIKGARLQSALDSAVLAAAADLPIDMSDTSAIDLLKSHALDYAAKNNISSLDAQKIEVVEALGGLAGGIKVSATEQVELGFAKIFGIQELPVTRSASVRISPATNAFGAVPICAEKNNLITKIANGETHNIILKYGSNETEVKNGAFGALDITGKGGASDYQQWLTYGYGDRLYSGSNVLLIEPGNMVGPTYTAASYRLAQCTHFPDQGGCSAEQYVAGCPRVLTVPVVIYVDKHHVRVEGFASFVLEAQDSSKGEISGSYIRDTFVYGDYNSTNQVGGSNDFGVYIKYLSQ